MGKPCFSSTLNGWPSGDDRLSTPALLCLRHEYAQIWWSKPPLAHTPLLGMLRMLEPWLNCENTLINCGSGGWDPPGHSQTLRRSGSITGLFLTVQTWGLMTGANRSVPGINEHPLMTLSGCYGDPLDNCGVKKFISCSKTTPRPQLKLEKNHPKTHFKVTFLHMQMHKYNTYCLFLSIISFKV